MLTLISHYIDDGFSVHKCRYLIFLTYKSTLSYMSVAFVTYTHIGISVQFLIFHGNGGRGRYTLHTLFYDLIIDLQQCAICTSGNCCYLLQKRDTVVFCVHSYRIDAKIMMSMLLVQPCHNPHKKLNFFEIKRISIVLTQFEFFM